ncbi:MAG: GNAT family N-acetyltransferase [Schleiferiaceae bacterium]|nr:GNAT family N-acetyltransferase [Schleiferiaceae bacterium]
MTFRAFQPGDASGILAIYAPVVLLSSATFETVVPDLPSFSERLANIAGRFPFITAIDAQGAVVGYAYAATHRERIAYQWAVETSVYVAQPGQGLGRALYDRLLQQLTERGFLWAYGVITLPNDASVSLHKSCGYEGFTTYEHAGQKFGQWCDVFWMRKSLGIAHPGLPSPRFGPADELLLGDT